MRYRGQSLPAVLSVSNTISYLFSRLLLTLSVPNKIENRNSRLSEHKGHYDSDYKLKGGGEGIERLFQYRFSISGTKTWHSVDGDWLSIPWVLLLYRA